MAKKTKDTGAEDAPAVASGRRVLTLGEHPRAQASIARAKALAGIVGLVLGVVLSLRHGVPVADALARGIGIGIAAQLLAWGTAVLVWRQLAAAEIELGKRRLLERLDEIEAEARSGRAEAA
jgi:hypothetical protein